MNTNKRYCQNRVRKRKKNVENDLSLNEKENDSAEEERQFKLSRFVEDLNKFARESEYSSDKTNNMVTASNPHTHAKSTEVLSKRRETFSKAKRMKITSTIPLVKTGRLQNIVQTKVFNRGDYGKEMKARLNQSLREIISFGNKGNRCKCSHQCKTAMAASPVMDMNIIPARLSPEAASLCSPLPPQTLTEKFEDPPAHRERVSLEEHDAKLYQEFIRIVTNSCIERLSHVFRKKKYGSTVNKALVEIYLQGRREGTQELSCTWVSDARKSRSSVATSPLTTHSPLTGDSGNTFTITHFVDKPKKTNLFEETIGPGSSCNSISPKAQQHYFAHDFHPRKVQHRSPVIQSSQRETFPKCLSASPSFDFSTTMFDGRWGRSPFSHLNLNRLLPSIDEDSPEFQYYPRKMF